jgi:hypothetical protein
MRDERRLALLRELAESTRSGKLAWKAILPGAWDGFIAVTPSRHTFILSQKTPHCEWGVEIRDATGEVVDDIGGWLAAPETPGLGGGDAATLSALRDLVAAVDESALGPLESAIGALQELRHH